MVYVIYEKPLSRLHICGKFDPYKFNPDQFSFTPKFSDPTNKIKNCWHKEASNKTEVSEVSEVASKYLVIDRSSLRFTIWQSPSHRFPFHRGTRLFALFWEHCNLYLSLVISNGFWLHRPLLKGRSYQRLIPPWRTLALGSMHWSNNACNTLF